MEEREDEESQPLLTKHTCQVKVRTGTLLMVVCAASIGGTFQYGYNISIINAPTKAIQSFINQTWIRRFNSQVSPDLLTLIWSIIVSIFTLGGLVGSSVGATLAVRFGRKRALLINNGFAVMAAVFMGLSSLAGMFELLIIGRLLSGINAGIGACVQPLYLGELAPRTLRGTMSMGTSIFITGGILMGQLMGLFEILAASEYWPFLLSSTFFPAVIQLLFLPWFPESPRFLLIDREDESACSTALKQLHGGDSYHNEMDDMQQERDSAAGIKPKKPWELFTEHNLFWPLIIIIFISTTQQLNGINAIYFYAEYVFSEAGIPVDKIPYVTVGTGSLLIERWGRRALIIGGYSLMCLWCMCFTISLTFQSFSQWIPYLSMLCVFAFILSFGLGPGGVTNILITELFTQNTRPAAYMIAGSLNWLSFFFISMFFPFIVTCLQQFCFLVFLVICLLAATFIFLFVPETKNKTFLQIQEEFSSRAGSQVSVINGGEQLPASMTM